MSVEYRDGSFSENMPIEEAAWEFLGSLAKGNARALHVGTEEELDRIKEKRSIEQEVASLRERIEAIEGKQIYTNAAIQSDTVVIPTRDEMIMALRKW